MVTRFLLRPCAFRCRVPIPFRLFRQFSSGTNSHTLTYENILVERPKPGIGLVKLNRPRALNALSKALFNDLNHALQALDNSNDTSVIVLTGNEKSFAAGADISEMADLTFGEASDTNFIAPWSSVIPTVRKPIIAAVNGHALGGGCELALMADIIYCSETATFGQPEVKLGTIPGAGGSQRLTAIVGKSRAMELILTGKTFSGIEAEKWGVAARCFENPEKCLAGALATAEKILGFSKLAVRSAKEVVNKSQEVGLRDGVEFERKVFHSLFGSQDQKLGMKAFLKKEKADWVHR